MEPYADQLAHIEANLALVKLAFARWPELFAGAGYTSLDRDIPWVHWWGNDSTLERRVALARSFPDAGWKRKRSGSSIEWLGIIAGVEFRLGDMEKEPEIVDLGAVHFDGPTPAELAATAEMHELENKVAGGY